MKTFTRRITIQHPQTGEIKTYDITDDTPASLAAERVQPELEGVKIAWTLQVYEANGKVLAGEDSIVSQTTPEQLDFIVVTEIVDQI
jgi:hypothetical protein